LCVNNIPSFLIHMRVLGFIASLLSGASANRVVKPTKPNIDANWQLTAGSVPEFSKWRHTDGLFPQLQTGQDVHMTMWEHTNFKTSEFSFTLGTVGRSNWTTPFNSKLKRQATIGRFHTYYMGRSADFRIGVGKRQKQSKRLIRVTSHRHGNPFKNFKNTVYAIRDAEKHTRFTVVRRRNKGYRLRAYLGPFPEKVLTAAKRQVKAKMKQNFDVYEFFEGWCPNGPMGQESVHNSPKNQRCGQQVMTQICTWKGWNCQWYTGKVNPKFVADIPVVGNLDYLMQKMGKAIHFKQVWDLHALAGGDVGLMMVGAMLNDVIRAQESINLQQGHNLIKMDMR